MRDISTNIRVRRCYGWEGGWKKRKPNLTSPFAICSVCEQLERVVSFRANRVVFELAESKQETFDKDRKECR